MTRFQLRIGEETRAYSVTRQGDRLTISTDDGDHEVRIVHQDDDFVLIEIPGDGGSAKRVRLAGARWGDRRLLWVDGRSLSAERIRRTGGPAEDDAGSLSPAIPAVVAQLLVQPGDLVETGDTLILLESMKMVIPITAPHGGRVSVVHCQPGDSVPAGVPLLEITSE
jgi:biotin carboxyl carrier protein